MRRNITSEILRRQADNQFEMVLNVIGRAQKMIHSGKDWDQLSFSKNVALQAILDAEEGIDPSIYSKVDPQPEAENENSTSESTSSYSEIQALKSEVLPVG